MSIILVVPEPKEKFTAYGPPLGLCYLSSFLKMKGIHDIKGVDLNVDSVEFFKDVLVAEEYNIVGIYCATKTLEESMEIAKIAKKTDSIVIMGGPHPTLCPEDILCNENIDFVVIGEGEISFYELISAISEKQSIEKIKIIEGIGYKNENREMVINFNNNIIKDLDSLPFPDRAIFNLEKYPSNAMTAMATRGCPYVCTNCKPALDLICGKYRMRSVENILSEIKEEILDEYHYELVHFVDNDLTVNKKWMTEFCNKIIEEELKFTWGCQGGIRTLNKELMALMKRAGCINIGIGVESGSQRVLDEVIHKNINLTEAKNVINWANEVGIGIHIWLMIGIPLETKEEMLETIKFSSSLNVTSIGFSISTPWPKTGIYEICQNNGFLLTDNWEEYNEKRYCRIKTDNFSPEDVEEIRKNIFGIFRKKKWAVDETDFIMYNPYYNNNTLVFLKNKILMSMFYCIGEQRARNLYKLFKRSSNIGF